MITRDKALELLVSRKDYTHSPVLVHGTSVQAVLRLFEEERLPTSLGRNYLPQHPLNKGYIFFMPRKRAFVNHPFYDMLDENPELHDLPDLEEVVIGYAHMSEEWTFLVNKFGNWPSEVGFDELYAAYTNKNTEILQELIEEGVNLKEVEKYGFKKLDSEVKQRKGVVIGLNKNVLKLNIEDGYDQPGYEVMIHLPNGLDISNVQYVRPLGTLEQRAFNMWLRKK